MTTTTGAAFAEAVTPAPAYVPLTERLIEVTGSRRLTVALFATLPFVHLVAYEWLLRINGLSTDGPEGFLAGVPSRVVNTYLIVLTFWASRRIAARLASLQAGLDVADGALASWRTWLLPPLLLDLALSVANEISHAIALGTAAMIEHPAPFALSEIVAFLIRIPTMTAFWSAVVALLEIARIGREGRLGPFPEDRSLGLRSVGQLVFELVALLTAGFLPAFLLSGGRFDPAIDLVLFATSLGAMILAIWRLHERMVVARSAAIAHARAQYAAAYRAAATSPGSGDAATALTTTEALLRGAESIHEWPFDDRTQRLVALVLTGVVTGLIVRVVLYFLGI